MSDKKIKIPYNKPFIVGKELYNIAQAVIQSHLSGDGPFTLRCHQWLERRLGCAKALLTHSCTGALEMAAMLCDLKAGDEVIMPSFTFVSTANAFVLRGAVPVFVDIRPDTLNMDEKLIEKAITPKTKAIVPVHYAGAPCAMDVITDLAARHRLYVIEDAAQGLLSKFGDQYLGTIGQLGCLSFHETKNIISGEGGALLINDPKLIERAEIIREKGTNRKQFFRGEVDKYTWVDIGSSYLPSEIVGAFLFAQFEMAEKIIAARQSLMTRYFAALRPLAENGLIRLPYIDKSQTINGHIFYILLNSAKERNDLIDYLKADGISSIFHYIPLHSSPAGKKYCKASENMDVTNTVSETIVRLPLFYEMKLSEVDRVAERIRHFFMS